MTREQAAANRRVINAAKQIERAAQYGANGLTANHEYDEARAELQHARTQETTS